MKRVHVPPEVQGSAPSSQGCKEPISLFTLVLAVILAGCSYGGRIGALPVIDDPAMASTVIVIRPWTAEGAATALIITIDGREVYKLGTNEHIVIPIPAGERVIGTKLAGWPKYRAAVRIQVAPARTYYVFVAPASPLPTVTQLSDADGRDLVQATAEVQ